MDMDIFLGNVLNHTWEKMLKSIHILAMHTYEKSTIWSLYADIIIISIDIKGDILYGDSKSDKELIEEGMKSFLHIMNIIGVII